MQKKNKTIILKNGDKYIIHNNPNHVGIDFFSVGKGCFKNGTLEKSIMLSKWDDFAFEARIYNREKMKQNSEVSFLFQFNDPIYMHLKKLLGNEESFVIDDDETNEYNNKTMKIHKDNNNIIVSFQYKLEDQENGEKFRVFIKNIGPDPRSKMDWNNKKRLIMFFDEIKKDFLTNREEIHEER